MSEVAVRREASSVGRAAEEPAPHAARRTPRAIALPAADRPASRVVRVAQLLQLCLLLLVVANLARLPVLDAGTRSAPILLNDVAVAVVLAAGGIVALQRRSLRLDRVALAALAFAGVGALAAVVAAQKHGLAPRELVVSLAYLARWLFYFGLYVVVINALRAGDVLPTWRALETAVLLFAAFGIFQAAFLPNFAQMVYPDSTAYVEWDIQRHRLVSTLLDPNFAGGLILVGLLVQLAGLALGARVAPWKPTLLFVALVLTVSRSSLLAFAAGMGVVVLAHGLSRRVVKLLLLAGVLGIAALPALVGLMQQYGKLTADVSGLSRIVMWLRGVRVFIDHPVLGIGFNTWGAVQERYGWQAGPAGAPTNGIEGGLLFIAVLTGVVGLAVYCWMLRAVARNARRVWRDAERPAEHRALAVGTVAVMVAILVHSLFTNSILLPFLMEPQWVLWGLVTVMAREAGGGTRVADDASAVCATRDPRPAGVDSLGR